MASALLAWLCCTGLPPSGWRLHKQKVIPRSYQSPEASGSAQPTTGSGVHAWLGSAGEKAHSIHYIQLGHLFPVAGSQETAVQSCYLR